MRLFYDPTIQKDAKKHTLSEEESKHICKVLRLNIGDEVLIINGLGSLFYTKIIDSHPKKCAVEIISQSFQEEEKSEIHIAIAPTKMMDRLEWFLEKATEIGITEITPLLCSNSERKQLKDERLEKILISAIKQSKQMYLPQLNPLTDFNTFIQKYPQGLIAHCYEIEGMNDKNKITEVFEFTNCPILIGPEGDFSTIEVEKALISGYKTITLGANRLRTETAGLYAVMQAKLMIDNF
ncbi:MAG: 16S rRNA (uracil(1498)-N(3))-methyltransferase [Flavobacteriia bacterium]|nr:16S rRNA (uracil(1498)-N(3))-methyltransferase [Flavobacteriia bacterium]